MKLRQVQLALAALVSAILVGAGPAAALKDMRDLPALMSALNDLMSFADVGRSLRWDNPETGNSGEIRVLHAGSVPGRACWDYERTYEDNGAKAVRGTACEVEAGLWEIVQEGQAYAEGGTPPPASQAVKTPQSHDRNMVRQTQALLTALNYDPGPVDGTFGPRTGKAISAYQQHRGLPVTGVPSEELLISLRGDIAALQPPSQPAVEESTTKTEPAEPAPSEPETTKSAPAAEEQPQAEDMPWLNPSPPPSPAPTGSGSGSALPPPPPPPPPPPE